MIYTANISTPASTTQGNAQETAVVVNVGVVHKVRVGFPPGPETDLHVVIDYQGQQVWPSFPQQDFAWDNHVFEWDEWFEVTGPPLEFTVRTWNDDADNPHECVVTFDVLPLEVLRPAGPDLSILQRIGRALGIRS